MPNETLIENPKTAFEQRKAFSVLEAVKDLQSRLQEEIDGSLLNSW